jgi:hypothetical protein
VTRTEKTKRALAAAMSAVLSKKQLRLRLRHGTPADFAKAVYACVPGDISMDEARTAIDKYNQEWQDAA